MKRKAWTDDLKLMGAEEFAAYARRQYELGDRAIHDAGIQPE